MASTYNGIGNMDRWENLQRRDNTGDGDRNVGRNERLASGLAGAAIVAFGLKRGWARTLLLPIGGSLLARAITGRCAISRAIGRNTADADDTLGPSASVHRGEGIKIEKAVTVQRPRADLYQFWRNFENLPRFMEHLESVRVIDDRRSHWVAKGPAGSRIEWDAEINNEIPDELIAWRTLPNAQIHHAGSVHFSPVQGGGTDVRIILRYEPPAGKIGAAAARLFGEEPSQQIDDDLRRFKQVMEAGEFAAAG